MDVVLDWRSVGSLIATVMVFRAAMRDYLPPEARQYLRGFIQWIAAAFRRPEGAFLIEDADGTNDLYDAAQLYLNEHLLTAAPTVRLHKQRQAPRPVASLPDSHITHDTFRGVPVRWTSHVRTVEQRHSLRGGAAEQRSLELHFPLQHRDIIYHRYIDHIIDDATRIRLRSRQRKLYTNNPGAGRLGDYRGLWEQHTFSHPSTFDTLALDPAQREDIRGDLLRFAGRQERYARAGRAWKRGYLLHGPPGTGKTSLVAAMANLLDFDVYDLELTTVLTNSHLRSLLVSTSPKSLIVIEDIDCSLDLSDRSSNKQQNNEADEVTPPVRREQSVSLSGVLNFVDGLFSTCVGERLMVFTTNHPERLDAALLRRGRMDKIIQLGYCTPAALRVLARNYLGVGDEDPEYDDDPDTVNSLMAEAEGLLAAEVRITPADVAEVFMGCDGAGAAAALRKLIDELGQRRDAPRGALASTE